MKTVIVVNQNTMIGYDCKKLCEYTDYYTCDEAGNKVCEENYYPDKDCSTFCEGVEEYL